MTSIRRLLPILVAFLCAAPAIGQSATAPPQKSDRERHGLRGPVEECDEEKTVPALHQRDKVEKWVTTLKYSPDGNIYQIHSPDGLRSITYDAEGRILAEVPEGRDASAVIYTYDSQNRLVAINGEGDWTTTFEYDDEGRKTRIVKSNLKPSSPYHAEIPNEIDVFPIGGIVLGVENQDMDAIPPDGGIIRTSFNERGQATESEAYDLDGELTGRVSETYDAKGRTTGFSVIEIRSEFLEPEGRKLLAANPAAYEDVKYERTEQLSYTYDDENHVVEKRDDLEFSHQTTLTNMAYNDHGDEAQEIETTYDGDSNQPQGADAADIRLRRRRSRIWLRS